MTYTYMWAHRELQRGAHLPMVNNSAKICQQQSYCSHNWSSNRSVNDLLGTSIPVNDNGLIWCAQALTAILSGWLWSNQSLMEMRLWDSWMLAWDIMTMSMDSKWLPTYQIFHVMVLQGTSMRLRGKCWCCSWLLRSDVLTGRANLQEMISWTPNPVCLHLRLLWDACLFQCKLSHGEQ